MGLLERIKWKRSRDHPTERTRRDDRIAPLWGALMNLRVERDLKGSEAIYSAVSRIANTVACMPLHLYKGYELQVDDPRERCVSYAPNPTMTPYNFKLAVEASRDTQGVAYILNVVRPDGVTTDHLDPIDPSRVTVLYNTDTGEYWYRIALDNGRTVTVHSSYMIVLHHMSTDGVNGVSPIEVLGGTLKYDRKVQEASETQLEGFGDSIVLHYATSISDERRQQITQDFLDAYKASRGHVIILDSGITADRISGNVVDPKVLDVDNITKRKVAAVYNMPPRMLGDSTASGYSTSEQDINEFVKMTILPIVKQWEESFNRKLLTYEEVCEGYAFRFDMDSLLRGDTAAIADKHQKGVRSGTLKPNEARAENGLPPAEYGDELFISRDLIPARIAIEHPEMLLGSASPNLGDEDESQPEREPETGNRRQRTRQKARG